MLVQIRPGEYVRAEDIKSIRIRKNDDNTGNHGVYISRYSSSVQIVSEFNTQDLRVHCTSADEAKQVSARIAADVNRALRQQVRVQEPPVIERELGVS